MISSTAIFFFTQTEEDFVSHGAPVLCRLQEKYDEVHLVTIENLQVLIPELDLGINSVKYLSAEQLSSIDDLSKTLADLHTEQTSYYNYSHQQAICLLLGELRNLSEVYGFYNENHKLVASNSHGLYELERHLNSLSFYQSRNLLSTRDHYLKLLDLKPYRKKNPELIKTSQTKKNNVLLELSKADSTQNYERTEELQSLIEAEGLHCIDSSRLKPKKAIEILKGAKVVISNGGYLGGLAQSSNIPVLNLLAKNTICEQKQNVIISQQPCSPCLKNKCSQLSRQSSCLGDIHPVFIVDKLQKVIKGLAVKEKIYTPWPEIDYKNKKIHIFCIHGLGDAIRFAVPLAKALSKMGAIVSLHIRDVLESAIGIQQDINICPLPDSHLKDFDDNNAAILNLLGGDTPELIIGLGGSYFDLEVARVIQNEGIPYWGSLCSMYSSNYESSHHWSQSLEVQKSRDLLFSLLGIRKLESYTNLLNPYCDKEIKIDQASSILIHTQAMWPAKTYEPRIELIRNLAQDFTVWNFDNPCDSIGELALYIKQCKAVLTVDTLVLHLANSLGTPTLLIQGPIWHNWEHAPSVIQETQTSSRPVSIENIDKESSALSAVPAQVIADRFRLFLETLGS